MLFPTVQFALFFPLVLAVSWALMRRQHVWKWFIVGASYAFYASANWRFCLLLAGVTVVNHIGARLIHRSADERRRRRVLGVTVALDLGALAVFKYYGFFVESTAQALGTVGLDLPLPLLTIALPVGVSFFTFQAISYVVDVERGQVGPAGRACAVPRRMVLPRDAGVAAANRLWARGARVVDLTRYFCTRRRCLPVVGGVLVHKDADHLTQLFAGTLGPFLLRHIDRFADLPADDVR